MPFQECAIVDQREEFWRGLHGGREFPARRRGIEGGEAPDRSDRSHLIRSALRCRDFLYKP